MLADNNKIFHRKKILTVFLVCTGIFVLLFVVSFVIINARKFPVTFRLNRDI